MGNDGAVKGDAEGGESPPRVQAPSRRRPPAARGPLFVAVGLLVFAALLVVAGRLWTSHDDPPARTADATSIAAPFPAADPALPEDPQAPVPAVAPTPVADAGLDDAGRHDSDAGKPPPEPEAEKPAVPAGRSCGSRSYRADAVYGVCLVPGTEEIVRREPGELRIYYSGTVTSVREGEMWARCPSRLGVGRRSFQDKELRPHRSRTNAVLTLESDGQKLEVGVVWPARLSLPRVGERMRVTLQRYLATGGGDVNELELSSKRVRLAVSAARGSAPDELLGVSFEDVGERCSWEDGCAVRSERALRVRLNGGRWRKTSRSGAATLGNVRVRVLSSATLVRDKRRCLDHGTGGHTVLVWR